MRKRTGRLGKGTKKGENGEPQRREEGSGK